jgi:putative exosortase-associated protein (TIGR04073 family)
MKEKLMVIMVLLALLMMPAGLASASDVWTMAQSDQYGQKTGGMLGRGLVNAATCFVDVIVQTVDGTKNGPPFLGSLTGLGGGIGCTALRAVSGVLDVGTFWVPGFNGFPVSKSYNNCLCMDESCAVKEAPQPVQHVQAPAPTTYVVPAAQAPAEPKPSPAKYAKK